MNERPIVEGRWVVRALRMIPKLDWILLAAGIWMTLVLVATLVASGSRRTTMHNRALWYEPPSRIAGWPGRYPRIGNGSAGS